MKLRSLKSTSQVTTLLGRLQCIFYGSKKTFSLKKFSKSASPGANTAKLFCPNQRHWIFRNDYDQWFYLGPLRYVWVLTREYSITVRLTSCFIGFGFDLTCMLISYYISHSKVTESKQDKQRYSASLCK